MSLDSKVRWSKITMLLGLTDALTAHHCVFYFTSLEVEEGFYFNVFVIPCVQFHIAVPGISSLTTEVLPFLSFQAAAASETQTLVLMSVVSSKFFCVSQFYTSFIAGL